MMNTENNAFTGFFVPARLWLCPHMNVIEKAIVMEVWGSKNAADNEQLRKLFEVPQKVIDSAIQKLIEKNVLAYYVNKNCAIWLTPDFHSWLTGGGSDFWEDGK